MADILPGVLAVAAVGALIFVFFFLSGKAKTRKEVMFLRPRDLRGERLEITKETDKAILCEQANPIHRFIKIGPGWTFKEGGKTSHRFFGVEGSAYTAVVKGTETFKVALEEYLQTLWGPRIYLALPQKLKDAIEKDKFGVTVEPAKINAEDKDLPTLSSDDVNDEGDATILQRLAKFGASDNPKTKMLNNIIWLGLGIGLAAILKNFGWF